MARRFALALLVLAMPATIAACGQEANDIKQPGAAISLPGADAAMNRGAKLFVERCSSCHNLDVVGAEGGALKVHDRERVDGPNFNVRKEDKDGVLYAIRNGGFSGAIMPQNIVVGSEADDVAAFLAKYAGHSTVNPAAGGENQKTISEG